MAIKQVTLSPKTARWEGGELKTKRLGENTERQKQWDRERGKTEEME